MKKIYLLAVAVLATVSAQAQRAQVSRVPAFLAVRPALPAGGFQALAAYNDTLSIPGDTLSNRPAACDTVTLYYAGSNRHGGYVSGNNRYGDLEKVMKFNYNRDAVVKSIFAFIGGKIAGRANSDVYGVAYGNDGAGFPDTTQRYLTDPKSMRLISDGRYNRFDFFGDTGIVNGDFFVGIVLPKGVGDTIGIYQNRTFDPRAINCSGDTTQSFAFERDVTGAFFDMNANYNPVTKFELSIFPIIQYQIASVSQLLSSLVKVHPMPAQNNIVVTLPYNTKGASAWQLYTVDGRLANSATLAHPEQLVEIERGNLRAGVYTLRMQTPAGPVAKRVIFN